jgi:hypothetical protein
MTATSIRRSYCLALHDSTIIMSFLFVHWVNEDLLEVIDSPKYAARSFQSDLSFLKPSSLLRAFSTL